MCTSFTEMPWSRTAVLLFSVNSFPSVEWFMYSKEFESCLRSSQALDCRAAVLEVHWYWVCSCISEYLRNSMSVGQSYFLACLYEVQGELLQSPQSSASAFPSHCDKVLYFKFSKSSYLDSHSSESIHICTIGTLEGWLSFHISWHQGWCLGWC